MYKYYPHKTALDTDLTDSQIFFYSIAEILIEIIIEQNEKFQIFLISFCKNYIRALKQSSLFVYFNAIFIDFNSFFFINFHSFLY